MKKHLVDALIVPTEDPHMSEYTAACFGRREFISGFTGSAGTAVITTDQALLFTDGRYHSQAEKELDANWTLMKVGVTGVPTPTEYLTATLARKTAVAVDPAVHSAESYKQLQEKLRAKDISIFNMATNAIDLAWGVKQPTLPTSAVREHPIEYAGQSVAEKLALLRAQMKKQGACALVVSMLDEIAWLFNIRGGDVECNPVALSYALVTQGTYALCRNGSTMSVSDM
jgi:Xaa-Pro aminopeptidase